jgi:hypothetical protein
MSESLKTTFVEEVLCRFRFLVDDYGFSNETSDNGYVIRFKSDDVELAVYCDPRSNELDVAIGMVGKRSYGLSIILEAMRSEKQGLDSWGLPPCNKVEMMNNISEMAELVRKYCSSLLQGNNDAFQGLESVELRRGQRGMEQYRQEVRERAAKAYADQDYFLAVYLYESIKEHLTESDNEMLKNARKKVQRV